MLFKALKDSYEHSGASAEFYARQKYDNARISDYDSICDFLTALMNLAYHVNNEIPGSQGRIEDRMIAMRIIHSLPPCMRMLQTILIKSAPSASDMSWNLDNLRKDIDADELRARAVGENLGTKLDSIRNPKALTAEENKPKGKEKDMNDPVWLACQSCWRRGKLGIYIRNAQHLRQKGMLTWRRKLLNTLLNAMEPMQMSWSLRFMPML